jgi:hypothetical protein
MSLPAYTVSFKKTIVAPSHAAAEILAVIMNHEKIVFNTSRDPNGFIVYHFHSHDADRVHRVLTKWMACLAIMTNG